MDSSTQFVPSGRMGIYEPVHYISTWGENFSGNRTQDPTASMIIVANPNPSPLIIAAGDGKLENQSEETSHSILGNSSSYDQEATKPLDKVKRRLAQNREAARKCRLRKKAYVQQLESSRLKLIQLEQELQKAKQQGLYVGGAGVEANQLGFAGTVNPAIATFEMEYGRWLEEHNRHTSELKTALNTQTSDVELRILVESGISRYVELFRMKASAAKADVFYLLSGLWRSSAERFFTWIGGFRPSEVLKVLIPQIELLTEQQQFNVSNLQQSCEQAEDSLSQGLEKLQYHLAKTVADSHLGEAGYMPLAEPAMEEKLEGLVRFAQLADHLRQETMQQMSQILTTRQSARGLLALGEYIQRLRALSSLWSTRPREPT